MKRPCYVCGTDDDCRLHLPDGRTVDAFIDDHPIGATLEEIGAAFGFTRERARQIEHDALLHVAEVCTRGSWRGVENHLGEWAMESPIERARARPNGIESSDYSDHRGQGGFDGST